MYFCEPWWEPKELHSILPAARDPRLMRTILFFPLPCRGHAKPARRGSGSAALFLSTTWGVAADFARSERVEAHIVDAVFELLLADVTHIACVIRPVPGPTWPQARIINLVKREQHGLILARHGKEPIENHPEGPARWLGSDLVVEKGHLITQWDEWGKIFWIVDLFLLDIVLLGKCEATNKAHNNIAQQLYFY